jgi:hypothetical protein
MLFALALASASIARAAQIGESDIAPKGQPKSAKVLTTVDKDELVDKLGEKICSFFRASLLKEVDGDKILSPVARVECSKAGFMGFGGGGKYEVKTIIKHLPSVIEEEAAFSPEELLKATKWAPVPENSAGGMFGGMFGGGKGVKLYDKMAGNPQLWQMDLISSSLNVTFQFEPVIRPAGLGTTYKLSAAVFGSAGKEDRFFRDLDEKPVKAPSLEFWDEMDPATTSEILTTQDNRIQHSQYNADVEALEDNK